MTRSILLAILLVTPTLLGSAQSLRVGSQAPLFSASTLDGREYDLAKLRGSVVVLTFWSTRCTICRVELPRLNQLAGRYDKSKVYFLALTPEDDTIVGSYLHANTVDSVVLPNTFGVMLKYADRDADGNINIGYPAFFVVDGSGAVQYRTSGYNKTGSVSSAVDRLLSK
jgi:peroxiredoxin